jgi:hypothetical protein
MKRRVLQVGAVLMACWLAFVAFIYTKMSATPPEFAAVMADLPRPAMMLVPFQPMWSVARAGTLQPGDAAPDFALATADRTQKVRLSDQRGRPVVLIFGSYT